MNYSVTKSNDSINISESNINIEDYEIALDSDMINFYFTDEVKKIGKRIKLGNKRKTTLFEIDNMIFNIEKNEIKRIFFAIQYFRDNPKILVDS
jgi:hypothetical protein